MSNQEHFDLSGQKIAPKYVERIHTETQKQEVDEKEKDPRLETVLERINFDILRRCSILPLLWQNRASCSLGFRASLAHLDCLQEDEEGMRVSN